MLGDFVTSHQFTVCLFRRLPVVLIARSRDVIAVRRCQGCVHELFKQPITDKGIKSRMFDKPQYVYVPLQSRTDICYVPYLYLLIY